MNSEREVKDMINIDPRCEWCLDENPYCGWCHPSQVLCEACSDAYTYYRPLPHAECEGGECAAHGQPLWSYSLG